MCVLVELVIIENSTSPTLFSFHQYQYFTRVLTTYVRMGGLILRVVGENSRKGRAHIPTERVRPESSVRYDCGHYNLPSTVGHAALRASTGSPSNVYLPVRLMWKI